MTEPLFQRAAIIGLGLIGGSIAKGLSEQGSRVSAYDQNPDCLDQGMAAGVIDHSAPDIKGAIDNADFVVVCVPMLAMEAVFEEIRPIFDTHVVITDVGSVKQTVVDALVNVHGKVPENFVPSHPIAGSEKHGVTNARQDLFMNHRVILTPGKQTSAEALLDVETFWQSLGAEVNSMSVKHHDEILAQTSHLPHLLAFMLIDTLSHQGDSLEVFDYAAGGLRDFSRIAASDPTMWRDIFESNRGPILDILDQYMKNLSAARKLIDEGQMAGVFDILLRAKEARDHFSRVLDARADRSKTRH